MTNFREKALELAMQADMQSRQSVTDAFYFVAASMNSAGDYSDLKSDLDECTNDGDASIWYRSLVDQGVKDSRLIIRPEPLGV